MKKKIIFSVPNGLTAYPLLRTEFLTILLDRGIEVILFTPLGEDELFKDEFKMKGVTIEVPDSWRPSRLEKLVSDIGSESFINLHPTETQVTKRKKFMLNARRSGLINYIRRKSVIHISRIFPAKFWQSLYQFIFYKRAYTNLLEKYSPYFVLVCTPGINFKSEIPLIHAANRLGTPIMAVNMSWDHLSAKYKHPVPIDYALVWNKRMKVEAMEVLKLKDENVHITGPPMWDLFHNKGNLIERKLFLTNMEARPNSYVVTLGTSPKSVYKDFDKIIQLILRSIDSGRLPPIHLLVRLHPFDDLNLYKNFQNHSNVTIEWPFTKKQIPGRFNHVDVSKDDQIHLMNTLYHSDVLINTNSTLNLEACYFNTPIINVAFNFDEDISYEFSVHEKYNRVHSKFIYDGGAVKLPNNENDFIETIDLYLKNPELDADERKKVFEKFMVIDGNAGRRSAEAVLGYIK